MIDLKERFQAADGIPAPDLSTLVQQKLDASVDERRPRLSLVRSTRAAGGRHDTIRRVITIAAALLIAAAAIGIAIEAFRSHGVPANSVHELPFMRRGSEFLTIRTGHLHNHGVAVAVDPSTGKRRQVIPEDPGNVQLAVWSPDGTRLLYEIVGNSRILGHGSGFYVMDATGDHALGINWANYGGWIDSWTQGGAAWSPDGSRIAVVGPRSYRGTPEGLFIVPVDGWEPSFVPGTRGIEGQPTWSADGSFIAIHGPGGGGTRIVSPDGSHSMRVPGSAVWQPNGTHLAYGGTGQAITVSNGDGSDPHVVAHGRRFAWSSDGTRLVVVSFERASPQEHLLDVWLVSPDGSAKSELFHSARAARPACGPVWSPDGQSIAFDPTINVPEPWRLVALDGSSLGVSWDDLPRIADDQVRRWPGGSCGS